MKKTLIVFFCLITCLCASMFFACSGGHEHKFDGYEYSETQHWQTCKCGAKNEAVSHAFNDASYTSDSAHEPCTIEFACKDCGYKTTDTLKSAKEVAKNFIQSVTAIEKGKGFTLSFSSDDLLQDTEFFYFTYDEITGCTYNHMSSDYDIDINGEIFFSKDDNGNLVVNGSVKGNADIIDKDGNLFSNANMTATAVIKDMVLYLQFITNQTFPSLSGIEAEINENDSISSISIDLLDYLKNLDENGWNNPTIDMIMSEILPTIVKIYNQEGTSVVSSLWKKYGNKIVDIVYSEIKENINITKVDDGYEYSVSLDKLKEINSFLSQTTLDEMYQSITGNSLTTLSSSLENLFDLKVSDVLKYIFTSNFSIEDLDALLDRIAEIMGIDEENRGWIFDIPEILSDPELLDTCLGDLIPSLSQQFLGTEKTEEEIIAIICQYAGALKDFSVYDFLLMSFIPSEKADTLDQLNQAIKDYVDEMLDIYDKWIGGGLTLDENGAFKSLNFKMSPELKDIEPLLNIISKNFGVDTTNVINNLTVKKLEIDVSLTSGAFVNALNVDYSAFLSSFPEA